MSEENTAYCKRITGRFPNLARPADIGYFRINIFRVAENSPAVSV